MTPHVLYNGATGGLGRYLGSALADHRVPASPLGSRLGDTAWLFEELVELRIEPGIPLTFVQTAGMVSVGECEKNPEAAFDINVTRTNETIRALSDWATGRDHPLRVVFVSSGHVYAAPEPGNRLTAGAPTEPRSVYAQTKLEGEHRIASLFDERDVDLVVARVFGMVAPGQRPHFLLPGLINRVRRGDLGAVPGLDFVRDYLDSRDIARHLASLGVEPIPALEDEHKLVINVCSGDETTIGELLDGLLVLSYADDAAALADARRSVGAARGRPTDIEWSVGDPGLLSQVVPGPIRSIPITDTLADAIADQV